MTENLMTKAEERQMLADLEAGLARARELVADIERWLADREPRTAEPASAA